MGYRRLRNSCGRPRPAAPVGGVSSRAPPTRRSRAAADLVGAQTLHRPAQQFFRGRDKPHRVRQSAVGLERRLIDPLGVNGEPTGLADGLKRVNLEATGLRPGGVRHRKKRRTKFRAPLRGGSKRTRK